MKQQKALTKNHEKTHKSDAFTFSDHIRELRKRAFLVALIFLVVSSVAYNYHDQLVHIVMAPLNGQKLVYLTPGGGFAFIFQITLYAGIIAAAPMFMYQLYSFVRPTLPAYAKRSAVGVACLAVSLMIGGVAYGYFIAIPGALKFLSTFAGAEIIPNLTAESYLSFFLSYVGGLALLFQLPLLLIFWHWISPLKPGGLLKSERFMIAFAFIAAAMITPTPDVMNQTMIALPLIVVYQIGVVTVLVLLWKARRSAKRAQPVVVKPIVAPITPPAPKPVATPAPIQPVVRPVMMPQPATSMRQQPVRRSIDGLAIQQHRQPAQPQPAAIRHLIMPTRPVANKPLMQRSPIMRIDGMSPL